MNGRKFGKNDLLAADFCRKKYVRHQKKMLFFRLLDTISGNKTRARMRRECSAEKGCRKSESSGLN
jgi:hypothetical protein